MTTIIQSPPSIIRTPEEQTVKVTVDFEMMKMITQQVFFLSPNSSLTAFKNSIINRFWEVIQLKGHGYGSHERIALLYSTRTKAITSQEEFQEILSSHSTFHFDAIIKHIPA